MDLRPPLAIPFSIFGAAATVTPSGGAPVATRVIITPISTEVAAGAGMDLRSHHRLIDVQRSAVPDLPAKSTVVVTEGSDVGSYVIDSVAGQTSEIHRAIARAA
jgi:hypothetical protein